jgi:hypothetical protein
MEIDEVLLLNHSIIMHMAWPAGVVSPKVPGANVMVVYA